MEKIVFKKIRSILILFCIVCASQTSAFSFTMQVSDTSPHRGDEFAVDVLVDTGGRKINTLEGVFSVSNIFTIKKVYTANSIVSAWVTDPTVSSSAVSFSGIVPGGYSGNSGHLMKVVIQAQNLGVGDFSLKNLKVYLHDGNGTAVSVANKIFNSKVLAERTTHAVYTLDDTTSPEEFVPHRVSDPQIFDGKPFVVFLTQDKGTGIAYYEVCERSVDDCVRAESPFMLKGQSSEKIYVKAFDGAGNVRVELIAPVSNYPHVFVIIIGILSVLILFILFRSFRKHA